MSKRRTLQAVIPARMTALGDHLDDLAEASGKTVSRLVLEAVLIVYGGEAGLHRAITVNAFEEPVVGARREVR